MKAVIVLSRYRRVTLGLLSWACALAGMSFPGSALHAEGQTIPVGVARADITPEYPVRLSGFGGRRAESEGIRQRIWARAMAIGAGILSLAALGSSPVFPISADPALILRVGATEWPHGELNVWLGMTNTFILIGSSVTMVTRWAPSAIMLWAICTGEWPSGRSPTG